MTDAPTELEVLRQEVADLQAALKPFVKLGVEYEEKYHDYSDDVILAACYVHSVNHGDYRRAVEVYERTISR